MLGARTRGSASAKGGRSVASSGSTLNPAAAAATTAASASAAVSEAKEAVTGARKLAAELEEAFLSAALAGWERSGVMMEKYNAKEAGKGGGGGEYGLQVIRGVR